MIRAPLPVLALAVLAGCQTAPAIEPSSGIGEPARATTFPVAAAASTMGPRDRRNLVERRFGAAVIYVEDTSRQRQQAIDSYIIAQPQGSGWCYTQMVLSFPTAQLCLHGDLIRHRTGAAIKGELPPMPHYFPDLFETLAAMEPEPRRP